jgi:hypothetical protein
MSVSGHERQARRFLACGRSARQLPFVTCPQVRRDVATTRHWRYASGPQTLERATTAS